MSASSSGPSCRTATVADTEPLLQMMGQFNALEGIAWTRTAAAPALRQLLADPVLGVVCLLFDEDVALGYFVVSWGFDLEWSGRDAFLTELYLMPEARGRGLGKVAMQMIERVAAEQGAHALHLMVRPQNAAALRLYQGAGFESPPRVFLSKRLP